MALRLRLFTDRYESPVSIEKCLEPGFILTDVITPLKDCDASLDCGFEMDSRQYKSQDATCRRLFPAKRRFCSEQSAQSPPSKKCRSSDNTDVIGAVDRLTTQPDLVADGSRTYTLPTIADKHRDLKAISVETMVDVLNGKYDDTIDKVTVLDCRYPYEFEGGHIKGAVNVYTKDICQSLLQAPASDGKQHVLIFHCEFSSERGPNM